MDYLRVRPDRKRGFSGKAVRLFEGGLPQMAGDVAETPGIGPKFYLGAEISLNLGILNLLPIPILDGGMIFILIIESIRRRDLSMNLKERIYQVAFVFLMVLMAFIIFNDISKFSIFHH